MSEGLLMKYFVLKPHGTDPYAVASREAMRAYAICIEDENLALAKDLVAWAKIEQDKAKEPTDDDYGIGMDALSHLVGGR